MRYLINGSLHGRVLEFSAEIRTRSVNHGTRIIKSLLTLQSEVSLQLNGSVSFQAFKLNGRNESLTITIINYIHIAEKQSRKVIICPIWIKMY
jgi:hypothetical protein